MKLKMLSERAVGVLCALIFISAVITCSPRGVAATETDIVLGADNAVLRQSQNTFIQWVLSLLPQRPTLANVTLPPTTAPQAATTTPATPALATATAASTTETTNLAGSSTPTTSIMSSSTTPKPLAPSSTLATTTTAPSSTTAATTTTTHAPSSTTPTTTRRPSVTTTKRLITTTTESTPPLIPLVPSRNCTDCVCGIANIQKRIVGGQETEIHQYPWMAMLLYGTKFYCAGTLINDQFLVTASHCVYGFRKERITVRLLEHDRKMSHFHKVDRRIIEITTHPKYNARTYDNDIAVLKLNMPVEITELLHPVCMPTPGRSFRGETGIVTGWGALKVGGPTSDTLQEVQVPIMSQDDCRKSKYGPTRITDNMLCAGYEEGAKDSCQGDSGGPLHVIAQGTREHQIAGVVSWGEGCAKAGYPGVYARVNRYGTWIKTLTKDACFCHSETKRIKK